MNNLGNILKCRDITLPTKVHLVKAMIFPIVMYGYGSWTIKKAEHQRIDAFELWCWRRLCDCKEIQPVHPKGNQSWIFIGRTDAEAGASIFWPPDEKNWLTGEDPDAGKDWRQEEKWATEDEMLGVSLSKFQEIVTDREAWRTDIHGVTKSQTWLSDWTTAFHCVSIHLPVDMELSPSFDNCEQCCCGNEGTNIWVSTFTFGM